MVRVIRQDGAADLITVPGQVAEFVPPLAYHATTFTWQTNGYSGRCSLCLQPALTMCPAGPRRWLAFCGDHDRQRRWVRDPEANTWWYLPPPLGNEEDAWWFLRNMPDGLAGGNPGWYLSDRNGSWVVDTYSPTIHRARVVAEWYLAKLLQRA